MSAANPEALAAAFVPFAVSMSFTPGPNNLMLASAGARFGFARTLPHLLGVVLGFSVMSLVVGLGVAGLIASVPIVYLAMKYGSIVYLLWLAWRIATAEKTKPDAAQARPMSFVQAAGFQWINPKAWIIALTAVTAYTDPHLDLWLQIVLIVAVLAIVGFASAGTWTAFGQLIRRYLTTPRRRVTFNMVMALLLVASVIPVLLER